MIEVERYWAKSPEGDGMPGESLVAHTCAVLTALIALRSRCPRLPEIAGEPRLWHRLALAVAAHDLGKVAPWFQTRVRGSSVEFYGRHEILSLAFLDWLVGDDRCGDLPWIAAAVASHHKNLDEISKAYPAPIPGLDDVDSLIGFVDECGAEPLDDGLFLLREHILPKVLESGLLEDDWTPPPAPLSPGELAGDGARIIRANLRQWEYLCDDLRLGGEMERFRVAARFLRGLIMMADHAASAGETFSLLSDWKDAGRIDNLFAPPANCERYPHQTESSLTPKNMVLVAPTGSGKTESAMLWAARQYLGASGLPPLFYVLPYKASMNAMRRRLAEKFEDRHVILQHSSAQQALYFELLDRSYSPRHAARVAIQHRSLARLHAAPIRVLSPYQLLRAAYQLKGHEAIWTDAAGGVFIFDEIHAYQPDRLARIVETLRHLVHDLGARAMVMTATMPPPVFEMLLDVLGQPTVVRASSDTFAKFRRHRLHLRDADLLDDSIADEILSRAKAGMAVLVVATTVGRAQTLRQNLQRRAPHGCQIDLLHSRFTGADRSKKEADLRHAVATDIDRNKKPIVLVATQVVEVSLDVEFDVLFSDPAPLEALVQRFGRVNRGRRHAERDVIVMSRIPDRSPVYHEKVVNAALDQLRRSDGELIDEARVQNWIDEVYAGPIGDWVRQEVKQAGEQFVRSVLSALEAFQSRADLEQLFQEMFDGTEVLPRGLLEKYRKTSEHDPLEAAALLVPITQGQQARLWADGRIENPTDHGLARFGPFVVNARYDSDTGLQINLPADEDDT